METAIQTLFYICAYIETNPKKYEESAVRAQNTSGSRRLGSKHVIKKVRKVTSLYPVIRAVRNWILSLKSVTNIPHY